MKHQVAGKKLNRSKKHRAALIKNLTLALMNHGSITTTLAKAKVIRSSIERMITLARSGSIAGRRQIAASLGKRSSTNLMVDGVATQFKNRSGGYTRIVRLGQRLGDSAMMAKIELIDFKLPALPPKSSEVINPKPAKTANQKSTKGASA